MHVIGLQSDFRDDICEMKSLLSDMNKPSVPEPCTLMHNSICATKNPLNDKHRVDHLRHMMVIKKDTSGKSVDKSQLEKVCVDDGV